MLFVLTRSVTPPWTPTNWLASNSFFNLYTSQDMVFARTWDSLDGGRMFLTADNGANWTQSSSADSDIDILSILMLNNNILAGTWNGFYLSSDGGTTWNAVTPTGIPADTAIWSIAMIGTTLFAGTTGDIYKSSDNANTWIEVNSGIPVNARITSIVESGNIIFLSSASNGVFKTTNDGTSWTEINSGLTDMHISQLVVSGTRLFAVTLKGVFVSDNDGMSWAADRSGLQNVNCFVVVNNQLFAGTDDSGIYRSDDNGATWISVTSGMPTDTRVWSLALSSDSIFAGTSSGVWRIPVSLAQSIPLVTSWNLVSFPLHPTSTAIADVLSSLGSNYDLVYAWDASGGHSGAGNWMRYAPGIPGNTLSDLDETMGFWIRMTADDTLEMTGSVPTTTNISLLTAASGWNLVGYPSDVNRSMPEALTAHGVTEYSLVYAYHADDTDTWKRYAPGVPGNDLLELVPGWGYWIKVGTPTIWDVEY